MTYLNIQKRDFKKYKISLEEKKFCLAVTRLKKIGVMSVHILQYACAKK